MRFRTSKSLLMVLALSITVGWTAKADIVNGGSLTSWSAAILDSPGTGPYWNNTSGDGPKYNIGWCMAGGGNCMLPGGPVGPLPAYTNAGAAPNNMYFTGNVGGGTSTLLVSITSQQGPAGLDSLYYYLTNASGTPISGNTFLFSAGSPAPTTVTVTIPAGDGYGLLLVNTQPTTGNTYSYYMDDALNNPADATQHFAIFQQSPESFYIGAEDGVVPGADLDYNDMIIHLSTPAVPEPASMGLLGGSLLLIGAFMRRRSKRATGK